MDLKFLSLLLMFFGLAMADATDGAEPEYDNPFSPDFMKNFNPFGAYGAPRRPQIPTFEYPKIEFPTFDYSKINIQPAEPNTNGFRQGVSVAAYSQGSNVNGDFRSGGGSEVLIDNNGKVERWINGVKVEN